LTKERDEKVGIAVRTGMRLKSLELQEGLYYEIGEEESRLEKERGDVEIIS